MIILLLDNEGLVILLHEYFLRSRVRLGIHKNMHDNILLRIRPKKEQFPGALYASFEELQGAKSYKCDPEIFCAARAAAR